MFKRLLAVKPFSIDLGLLLFRVVAGALMLPHGWSKLVNFDTKMNTFSDPLGVGRPVSLALTVGAEFFCAILLIFGLFTRVALIPLIIAMGVAFFIVHGGDPIGDRELAGFYFVVYVALFLTGPGKYSADTLVRG